MPTNPRSLELTGLYRARLLAARSRVERQAVLLWPRIEGLDTTDWPARMAAVVGQAQTEAVRATAGYLTAFASLELGRRQRIAIDSHSYAGLSRDGRPLEEALQSPLVGVLAKLKQGESPDVALAYGLERGRRMVSVDFDHAHRQALTDTIDTDPRFDRWERATAGTCGACLALSGTSGLHFEVHPNCNCVPQPVVKGVRDRFPLPDAAALFAAKSKQEQDAALGADTAEKVRSGTVELSDLVATSTLATGTDNFITQAPVQDAEATN